MNPVIETGLLIAATIIVGITLLLVPVPRHKPRELDVPPPAVDHPTPQELVTAPVPLAELSDTDRVAVIEMRLLHMQQQVQRMEEKVK